jgi:hypothetical protein
MTGTNGSAACGNTSATISKKAYDYDEEGIGHAYGVIDVTDFTDNLGKKSRRFTMMCSRCGHIFQYSVSLCG